MSEPIGPPRGVELAADEIQFGDRPTEYIHRDIAEGILRELKRINPALFGRLLMWAMVPDSKRERAPRGGQAGD
jgi:hypothetical protein